jgi:hypothetical protein
MASVCSPTISRILRAGISFGPEVKPGGTTTRHSHGLMFVCHQTSIKRQFESLQRHANGPGFVDGKVRAGERRAGIRPDFWPSARRRQPRDGRALSQLPVRQPADNPRIAAAIRCSDRSRLFLMPVDFGAPHAAEPSIDRDSERSYPEVSREVRMTLSTQRILITHVGSLARPPDLLEMLQAKERGESFDDETFAGRAKSAVAEVVRRQAAAGIDIAADGEMARFGLHSLCQ